MKERSSQSRDQSQRRRSSRFGKPGGSFGNGNGNKNKGRNKNFNRPVDGNRIVDGNRADLAQKDGPGVCVKCGHPAPDGKLCNFHRSLLNSIRNDYGGKQGPRRNGPSSPMNFNY